MKKLFCFLLVAAMFGLVSCKSDKDSAGNSIANLDRTWSVYKADEASSSSL